MPDRTLRVLLAEDSETDALLVQHDLSQSQGYRFEVALVGCLGEAVARLREQQFDVGLLDLALPDSVGFSTITRIQEACPNLPIVVLTGADDEAMGAEAIRLGVQDYLVKGSADGRFIGRAIRYAIERKEREQQLRKTAEELARSNKDLEHFAYVASHDLQEPLRTVRSYAQMLHKRYKGQLDTDADEVIGFVVDGAARMHALITDLLAYSRVSSAAQSLKPTGSESCLAEALSALRETVATSAATVTSDQLPVVNADKRQLTQLFQNLVANAIKFRRKEEAPRVHIGVREGNDHWLFSVKDNGIGIDPKYHAKVFTIFQRLHGSVEYPGTGIGLAICKRIVERHGGEMCIESEPGRGSTFFFSLPK